MTRALSAAILLLGMGAGLTACASVARSQSATQAYLVQARTAVQARDGAQAMAALDAAENAWLVANQPRPNPIVHHELPGLRQIGGARAAVATRNWKDAERYIDNALRYPDTLGA